MTRAQVIKSIKSGKCPGCGKKNSMVQFTKTCGEPRCTVLVMRVLG